MGTKDQTTYTLTCPQCLQAEKKKVLDKGSNYGGSHWQEGVDFSEFDVAWTGGGTSEPVITTAVCKKCNISPSIVSSYS